MMICIVDPSKQIQVPDSNDESSEESLSPNNAVPNGGAQNTSRSVLFEVESITTALRDVRMTCRNVPTGQKMSRENWYDVLAFYITLENRYLRTIMEARNPNVNDAMILLDDKHVTDPAARASLVQAYEDIRDQAWKISPADGHVLNETRKEKLMR